MLQTAPQTPIAPLPMPELYRRVERHIPPFEWRILADDVAAILRLKRERNAVVLAHNYQTPDIFHTVADIVGDSLALAREAARTDADVIVLAGVHFMAETAKLLNPEKTVLIPDLEAGCSLAASIGHCEVHERFTPEDIRSLRESHPGIIVLAHPECPPEVIAECDFSGSTAAMADYVGKERPPRVVLLTECSMSDNVALQYPDL